MKARFAGYCGSFRTALQVRRILALILVATGSAMAPVAWAQTPVSARERLSADSDWKFLVGDPAGAEAVDFQDAAWRTVSLPHDWSIEGTPDKSSPTGAQGGYFPAGVAWYRKTFSPPARWRGRRVGVEFDGVYMDATVFLNGKTLGTHPYGYSGFRFDLTPGLTFSGPNVLAVRVDNSAQPNSRWYSGSGIYRHVRVVVTGSTHVAPWGVFVTTPEISGDSAKVVVRTRVTNEEGGPVGFTVQTAFYSSAGAPAGKAESTATAAAGGEAEVTQEIRVVSPDVWSPEAPRLYRAVTRLVSRGNVVDEVVTPFGIRSLAWSPAQGFLLNGKPVKLAGGSVHHDNGPLGAAAFDRAEERRVELLKAAGFNAARTAHNPPSPAFLDACDRLGLLVLDEPFDVWRTSKVKFDYARFFDDWWQRDVDAMVLRDRSHPSVVMWGIGNEIPEAWTKEGAPIARMLADRVRTLDDTRPLTQALLGATFGQNPDAVFSVLDIGGYNYNLAANQAEDHSRVPARIMLTTESQPADAFEQWQLAKDNPYIVGEFVWTAMDYLGESGVGAWSYASPDLAARADQITQGIKMFSAQIGANGENPFANGPPTDGVLGQTMGLLFPGYPWHAANCGDLDLTGFRKPQSFYRDILWNGGDRVYATVRLPEPEGKKILAIGWSVFPSVPSWTWPGQEGKDVQVEVYSGAEKVRLYLDDTLVGEQPTGREQKFKATFAVPYAPGTLRAVGVNGERTVAESVLTTTGKPARLRLTPDRAVVHGDGQDLSFVVVEAMDTQGRVQPNADEEIEFAIRGPGVIAAVGNGDGTSAEPYQGNRRRLFGGRALVVVRTSGAQGPITLTARAPGLSEAAVTIQAQPSALRAELR